MGATKNHTNNNKKFRFKTTNNKKEQSVWDLWPDEPRVVVYIFNQHTTRFCGHNRKGEKVHLLPYILVTAPVFHFDTSWLNVNTFQNTARKERRVQQKEEKKRERPNHHTNKNKKVAFQTTNEKKEQNVWDLLWPDEPRVVVHVHMYMYIFNNGPQRKAPWPQRERDRVNLLCSIVVTALVFHLDTSWLNAYAKQNTARREKGATKKRKTKPTTQTTTNNKGPVSNHTKKKQNKTCENCDPTNLELYMYHTENTEGERERVHLL
jgi:hypothetical protein